MKELIELEAFVDEVKKYSSEFAEVCDSESFSRVGIAKAIQYWANEEIFVDADCPYQFWDLQEQRGDGEGMEQWYIFKRMNEMGPKFFVVWVYKGKVEEDFLREVRKTETLKSKWE